MIDYKIRFPDGTRHNVRRRGFDSKGEAEKSVPRIEAEFLRSHSLKLANNIFDNLIDEWLEYRKDKIKPTTLYYTTNGVNKHIRPYFSGQDINLVYTYDKLRGIRRHIVDMPLTQARRNVILRWLKEITEYAFNRKLITSDMYLSSKMPFEPLKGHETPKTSNMTWTIDQYNAFISTFSDKDRYKVLFQFMFFSGCRVGEVRALTWADYDQEHARIIISKSASEKTGQGHAIIQTPKTASGRRTIFLSSHMNDILCNLRDHYQERKPDGFIFFNNIRPIGSTPIRMQFEKHIKLAGLPHIRIHDIRHTCNTWLLNTAVGANEQEIIKRRNGHANLSMTTGTYYHPDELKARELAERIKV